MTIIDKSALVPISADKMFDLVLDVDKYSEFLPWCAGSQLISQNNNTVEGQITVSHTGFKQSFVTRNTIFDKEKITIELLDGPFKKLHGQWVFSVLDENSTKISLQLEFEFKSKLVSMAFGSLFSQMANSMVDSFCKRAMSVYSQ